MRPCTTILILGLLLPLGLLLLSAGCSSKRTFIVQSWPPGATVYVDDDQQGHTESRVSVDFSGRAYRTIRVEKKGMQPAGMLVDVNSPEIVSFVLAKAPSAEDLKEIANQLRAIQRKMSK